MKEQLIYSASSRLGLSLMLTSTLRRCEALLVHPANDAEINTDLEDNSDDDQSIWMYKCLYRLLSLTKLCLCDDVCAKNTNIYIFLNDLL